MRYLHTMLRVRNLDRALEFYCNALGLKEVSRRDDPKGRFTLVFLAGRGYDQPPSPRRHDGLRSLARPAIDRAPAEGRGANAARALALDV